MLHPCYSLEHEMKERGVGGLSTAVKKCRIFGTILKILINIVFLSDPEHLVIGRLDVSALQYLSKGDLQSLQAVEQGTKNHYIVGPQHQLGPGAAHVGQAHFEHATADPAQPALADGEVQGA